jgi:hypothetical protein
MSLISFVGKPILSELKMLNFEPKLLASKIHWASRTTPLETTLLNPMDTGCNHHWSSSNNNSHPFETYKDPNQ